MSADNKKNKINSDKSFGFVFFAVFLIIALWPLYKGNEIRIWSICVSLVFLILTIINSRVLTPLNRAWNKFGLLLGSIVSPIVMAFVFFLVITPTSFFVKIFGKDSLKTKYHKNKKSYWIIREKNKSSMKQQF